MLLTFRQLQVVRAVSQWGSVTRASAELGVSQPAVSMLLRESASVAGFPLFLRRDGRLQPTAETRVLLADLDRIFEGVDRVNRLVEDMRDQKVGTVHIAATPTLADNIVPPAVALFRKARPHVRITIQTMDNLSVVANVAREQVDFGLALSPVGFRDGRLVELGRADLVCIVPRDHPLAGQASVTPLDLADVPLISFSRSLPLGQLVEQAFRAAGIQQRIALEVNQSSLACALVRAGAGIAILDPFWLADGTDPQIVKLRLEPATPVAAHALFPPSGSPSRVALRLLSAIQSTAERLGSMPGEPRAGVSAQRISRNR
jgi:DNA-binding transcriptional LysR family regulator